MSVLLLYSQLPQAQEIYKWVDEKGTVHYSEDPNAVPEKYKNKAEKKDIDEFPPVLSYKPNVPQSDNRTQGPKSYYDVHPEERAADEAYQRIHPSPMESLTPAERKMRELGAAAAANATYRRAMEFGPGSVQGQENKNSQNLKSTPPPMSPPPPPPLPKRPPPPPPPPPPRSNTVWDVGDGVIDSQGHFMWKD